MNYYVLSQRWHIWLFITYRINGVKCIMFIDFLISQEITDQVFQSDTVMFPHFKTWAVMSWKLADSF